MAVVGSGERVFAGAQSTIQFPGAGARVEEEEVAIVSSVRYYSFAKSLISADLTLSIDLSSVQ